MSRFFRSVCAIFMPPFDGLGVVVILYIVWAHFMYPHNDVLRGNLPDPDDYMYLDQVVDWIKGQGWFDNLQHRLDPPVGTPIHFSRLAQIPMALGVLLFKLLGLKPHGAALLTALIYPFFLLGAGLFILRRVTMFVVPTRWAGASSYVALFSVGLLFEFMPGHVDHHGLVILLTVAAVGCLLQMMSSLQETRRASLAAIRAGALLALAMTIALECLPWVLLLSLYVGLWGLALGRKASHCALAFASSYLMGSILGLLLTRPFATLFDNDILTYSITYVILAACLVVPFVIAVLASGLAPVVRLSIGGVAAVLVGEFFLRQFPDLVTGPYGAIDPQLIPILLDNVQEAQPILNHPDGKTHILNLMSMGFLALPAALYFAWHARDAMRWIWGLITAVLVSAFLMTIFYQYRFLGVESAMAVIPLTALLYEGWQWASVTLSGRHKVFAEIGFLLLVGPLPAVIVPALFDSRSFNVGMLLFPVDSGHTSCDTARLETLLRDPTRLGDQPHLIVAPMDIGPELLFRTDHRVLSAPYHMDVRGNLDAARFFSTSFPDEARNIARTRGIDLVVACRAVSRIYLAPKGEPASLMERLFTNKAPDWLQRVKADDLDNYVVYRVARDAGALQQK